MDQGSCLGTVKGNGKGSTWDVSCMKRGILELGVNDGGKVVVAFGNRKGYFRT